MLVPTPPRIALQACRVSFQRSDDVPSRGGVWRVGGPRGRAYRAYTWRVARTDLRRGRSAATVDQAAAAERAEGHACALRSQMIAIAKDVGVKSLHAYITQNTESLLFSRFLAFLKSHEYHELHIFG